MFSAYIKGKGVTEVNATVYVIATVFKQLFVVSCFTLWLFNHFITNLNVNM